MGNYIATIRKDRQAYEWVNGWRYTAPDASAAQSVGDALVIFERSIHNKSVRFTELVTTTDPDLTHQAFVTTPLDLVGQLGNGSETLAPPNIVAFLELGAASGRVGKKFIRYALTMGDFAGQAGGIVVVGAPAIQQVLADNVAILEAALTANGAVLTIGKAHRTSSGIVWHGVTDVDTHKKYYDIKSKSA